ncbi:zf-HC2 domain-containing protein [Streptomyces sp. NBC_01724]|uniref:zf-HC2 domain-containing protein n=1 Tax=unclassified Streptomyces TaxID=2593676 RepID=UPI0028C3AB96|nr:MULTISPECIES: zf-HC2 domain-containing protein [unclassified Streptomyces]WNO68516.1 zf-HC2 domain-containing protein [Streptomyces sp. AM2-3-1]WSC73170.1 zf-HC2 domain-containing protein [Streptomyces sp. NBC_01760]WTE55552.1 zf-HC2 domain-containing protein [Streptomyces sp. NBC_01620]WTE63615.1 zf-HC2 domain-containing protein [Streptomyces sp. NBC_01617]
MTADPGEGPHVRQLLGAYVLDALTSGETHRVCRHLRECDGCTADYVEIAEAASLLGLVSEADLLGE